MEAVTKITAKEAKKIYYENQKFMKEILKKRREK